MQPLDKDGNAVSMWSKDSKEKDGDDDSEEDEDSEDDSDDEEDSDESDDDEKKKAAAAAADASREDRKAQKKARKEAAIAKQKSKNVEVGDLPSSDEDSDEDSEDEDMPANPNHSKAARKQAAKPLGVEEEVDEVTQGVKKLQPMSRKEREAAEAAAAKERYMKLHAAGKTDEAKSDLARLKLIREQREAESARRQVRRILCLIYCLLVTDSLIFTG